MSKSPIVITGAAGFIGSVLTAKLNHLGYDNLILVDERLKESPEKQNNLKELKYAEYFESDQFLRAVQNKSLPENISAVFHQGACSATTEMDEAYLKQNNTDYTRILAEWCVEQDIYFSYASSAATYGDGEHGYDDSDALADSLKPLNPYGWSKLKFDQWCIGKKFNDKITGFRYFNVYGPNEYHKGSMRSVMHKGFEQIRDTGKIKLFKSYRAEYPDGGQKRDFIYIKDVVDALIWFWKHPEHKGIYNLGTGSAQTWNDLAESIFAALGKPVQIEYIEMPDNLKNQYQYLTEADMKKFKATGCPSEFRNLMSGGQDYIQNYLLKENPHLSGRNY
ncbi:MAG: ADP-glyceromanno-heptose 6-epimerase [Candidatus Omnitrophica bacterium]|nr:ADP-glyceromanno-heptose 6-epimerase [Candidatus Omnitrophota bacterium]